ncbi:hypothetical protein, partial [Catenulispora rubra]|uniref:hypothetical protein n=1 Tax=Catenulispora rubra TaxID=280293 RepID=UPI001E443AB1
MNADPEPGQPTTVPDPTASEKTPPETTESEVAESAEVESVASLWCEGQLWEGSDGQCPSIISTSFHTHMTIETSRYRRSAP